MHGWVYDFGDFVVLEALLEEVIDMVQDSILLYGLFGAYKEEDQEPGGSVGRSVGGPVAREAGSPDRLRLGAAAARRHSSALREGRRSAPGRSSASPKRVERKRRAAGAVRGRPIEERPAAEARQGDAQCLGGERARGGRRLFESGLRRAPRKG